MFTVSMEKECGCFRKSDFQKEKVFDNRDDALLYAQAAGEIMNEDFCKKHSFSIETINATNLMIKVKDGGCCGSGHCG